MTHQLATGRFSGAQGISSATSASTLSDSTQAWTSNQFAGYTVQSYSSGQHTVAKVASNTGTALTITGSWDDGTPDSGQPYVVSNLQPAIGSQYHVGFTDGTHFYGYMLEPAPGKDGGYHDRSDITAKQSLIQYSSPNIIDRDFVYWPRVSQGDFSGGMGQAVGVDFSKYWDSTLNITQPGYLASFPQWSTATVQATMTAGGATGSEVMQAFAPPGSSAVYTISFAENNFRIYLVSAAGTTTTITLDIVAAALSHDSQFLYVSNGTTTIEQRSGPAYATNTVVTNAATVNAKQIWAVTQGTNGRWLYYSDLAAPSSLYRIDLTALPSAGVQVPLGTMTNPIIDLCAYQNGVAILTSTTKAAGSLPTPGWDLWFFDGANTTLLYHAPDRWAVGITTCQGNLYITDRPGVASFGELRLTQITSGSAQVVVRIAMPTSVSISFPNITPPVASGSKVYFAISNSPIQSLTAAYFGVFDAASGSFYHTSDSAGGGNTISNLTAIASGRGFVAVNDLLAYVHSTGNGGVGTLMFQNAGISTGTFDSGGKLITSRYDFSTPGIEKRFRRLEAIHAPIPTNCSLKIDAFVDKDPVAYSSGLTPDATITNSRVGSTTTDFFLSNLIGHSAYFVFTFSSSDNASTVVLNWFSVEITTPRAWEFTLACTNVIRLLNGQDDAQGLKAKDLADFWVDAWELPKRLTMFSRDGLAYAVALESFDRWNPSPRIQGETERNPSEEYLVHVVLRQTLVAN